jgi:ArsR family transcriptional regulator
LTPPAEVLQVSVPMNDTVRILTAVGNSRRLQVLGWLKDPVRHFPKQVDGDLVKDGVCSILIANKLGVSQPTTSRHMKLLVDAGLVRAKPIKQWIFYKRDEKRIAEAKRLIREAL